MASEFQYLVEQPPAAELTGRRVDPGAPPRVSFCIPTLNNETTLDSCLRSIAGQDYPDLEIVVVDGGSTDRTVEIARKYTDKICYDPGTYGSACQTGIEHSTGTILALFDSDIVFPHPRWLADAVRYFNYSDRVSTVWPENVAPPGAPLTTRLYFNYWKAVYADAIRARRGLFGGGNSLLTRESVEAIGGITREVHWGADYDWAQKLKERGYQVVYVRDPIYHDTMRTLRQFVKKQFVGAETFTATGPQFMDLTFRDVLHEQVFLGVRGMARGLLVDRDVSWLLFPVFLSAKGVAYLYTYAKNAVARARPS